MGVNHCGQELGIRCQGHAKKRAIEDMGAGNTVFVVEPIGHNNHVAGNQNLGVKGHRYANVIYKLFWFKFMFPNSCVLLMTFHLS